MRIGIVGCGLIGQKRAAAIGDDNDRDGVRHQLGTRASLSPRASALSAVDDWREVMDGDIDAVVRRDQPRQPRADRAGRGRSRQARAGREAGRAQLCEELLPVRDAARRRGVSVKAGYNHRFHPGLAGGEENRRRSGSLGPLYYIRARYGHGGRKGYEQEWRCDRAISGGGELIDQGAHLIDLSRWFLGELTLDYAATPTFFLADRGRGQLLPCAARRQRRDGVAACDLDRMEEHIFLRDHWPGRQADGRRPRRQLWHRAIDVLQNAPTDGPAGDDDLGISVFGRVLGERVRRFQGRSWPASRRTLPTSTTRAPFSAH